VFRQYRKYWQSWHLSLTLVFFILGFLIGLAFTTQAKYNQRYSPRKENLLALIKKKQEQQQRLKTELVKVQAALTKRQKVLSRRQKSLKNKLAVLNRLKRQAGLTPLKGAGLEVILGDAEQMPPTGDPDSYLIHDYDLQIVVNALWRGGAVGMAINNERTVLTSSIRSSGTAILVNSRPLGSPYKIKVVGPPKKLIKTLLSDSNAKRFFLDYKQQYGLVASYTVKKEVVLPMYKGSLRF
jgi:uncharacterized protein YlxW (UPF0749 family)